MESPTPQEEHQSALHRHSFSLPHFSSFLPLIAHLLLVSKPLAFPSEPLSFSTLAFPPQIQNFHASLYGISQSPNIPNCSSNSDLCSET